MLLAAALGLIDEGARVTVARLVERSGVSRAALYRRWPSLDDLVAAALDQEREVPELPLEGDLRETILDAFIPPPGPWLPADRRARERIRVGLADRGLQKTYFENHISGRRAVLATALQAAVERGLLREGLDIEACIDLMAGVSYYQIVARGIPAADPAAVQRCRAALEVTWRGMAAVAES